jgi:uncharacterized cupin superfamily protein
MCLASFAMENMLSIEIIDFRTATPEISESPPAADRVLAGNPMTTAKNFFSDAPNGFFAGVWQSTVGRWRVSYSEHEFCHITSGRVRIQSNHKSWEFGPGQSFLIPAGFEGIWEVLEPMSKLYVIYEPPRHQQLGDGSRSSTDPLEGLCAPA